MSSLHRLSYPGPGSRVTGNNSDQRNFLLRNPRIFPTITAKRQMAIVSTQYQCLAFIRNFQTFSFLSVILVTGMSLVIWNEYHPGWEFFLLGSVVWLVVALGFFKISKTLIQLEHNAAIQNVTFNSANTNNG